MMKEQSIEAFLDALASKTATPGGGSAAAIIGAMGAALVSMVCNFTVGRQGYGDVRDDMTKVLDKAETIRARLTGMVEDDIRVFEQVISAYRLPKDDDAQKARRAKAIQVALQEATDVPLACARACAEIIDLSVQAAETGNTNVISDAGVAVLAANAALRSAALNIYINIGNIKDKAFAESRQTELEELLRRYIPATETVYATVKSKL